MTALIFALGLLPQSADIPRYEPVHVYHFPANSPELEEAQKRNELVKLLVESIRQHANHTTDYRTERRIQELLHEIKTDEVAPKKNLLQRLFH